MIIKTYDVKCGIILILPDGKKMLFETEDEAVLYFREIFEDPDE